MPVPVLKRLTLVLTALAFLLAGVSPNLSPAMGMPAVKSCADSPAKAPAAKHFGMLCCASACAVPIAVPAPQPVLLPAFARLAYEMRPMPQTAGEPPAPDPFPPRPAALV